MFLIPISLLAMILYSCQAKQDLYTKMCAVYDKREFLYDIEVVNYGCAVKCITFSASSDEYSLYFDKTNVYQHTVNRIPCKDNHHVCLRGECIAQSMATTVETTTVGEKYSPEKSNCPANWFDCGNGKCISFLWLCDEEDDCENSRDELNCNFNRPLAETVCPEGHFVCEESEICLPDKWKCDGIRDCTNDERYCTWN